MTGAYLRVKRNNKYENVEIEYLTETELDELFKDKKEESYMWLKFLVNTLAPIARFIDRKDNDVKLNN